MSNINLNVNGKQYSIDAVAGETLSTLLRERLRLTGTKIGCEEAECGACTVLVDGHPMMSCVYPAERADGKTIVTIEGLAQRVHEEMKLHPLQEAFVEHGAVQCGFCIPGQIMTAYALLKRNPNPNSEDIRFALKDTLCRCAGYPSIENAIIAAAEALRTGEPVQKPTHIPNSIHEHKTVGHKHLRPEAVEKVTGDAIYTDDLKFDGMLYAKAKRAMIPHGFLKKLDVSKAKALPGIVSVLTAADVPAEKNHGLVIFDWPVMVGVGERVRYVGDALAI
ncbi:MAG: 2Fe-2S iron-sulfur cluster binding domain-containing protein, partial [Anaerolineales bacterium]|nr:2Fe-2S iron-sulfur cluster binding domain-containing protein [Anaerolineales bacterium]